MGAIFNQRIDRVDSLSETINCLQAAGRRVYAAALDEGANRLGDFKIEKGDCVVIGNEGHGLSETVIAACDGKVFIPMSGRAESFNAAVAASILMWEFTR
jgi:TrmH family RNA methyltransferase